MTSTVIQSAYDEFHLRQRKRKRHMASQQPTHDVTSNDSVPEPIEGALGATILGPRNLPLERENPDLLVSPQTDHGTIPNLKFSFAAARNRVLTGGWAREVTMRELPMATELAGVNMR